MDFDSLRNNKNFFLIAGPCVIESESHVMHMASKIKEVCDELEVQLIFKSSFDKANRTSASGFRGPGIEGGLAILKRVKDELGLPILTDVHESDQCARAAEVCDILQIPAFLCRQTDLLEAAGKTGRIINLKKGQFCSPITMKHAYDKIVASTGNNKVMLCDRGNSFGYTDLVVDYRNLSLMRKYCPNSLILQDITHSLQMPNQASYTLGNRSLIPTIARAAVATGVDGLFMEVHDSPKDALSDSATQWPLSKFKPLLTELLELHQVTKGRETDYLDNNDY
jgi:2-dehydro-3-deoxyphosphooctonate aldolase (KDO 8-P synthase)